MEAVLLIGIQGSGKSTFYERRFAGTHRRVSLDVLRTRAREMQALAECLKAKIDFVVDNTNVTAEGRQRFIKPAKEAGCRVIGYFFEPVVADCLQRNQAREGKARVPVPGLLGTLKRLERPRYSEGFDELRVVHARGDDFVVEAYVEPPLPEETKEL